MDRQKLSVRYWGRYTLAVAMLAMLWLLSPQLAGSAQAQANPGVDIDVTCPAPATPGHDDFYCTYTLTNTSTKNNDDPAPLVGPVVVETGVYGAPNVIVEDPSWTASDGSSLAMGGGGSTFVLDQGLKAEEEIEIIIEYYFPPDAHYIVESDGLVVNVVIYQTKKKFAEDAFALDTKFAPQAEIELDKILLNNKVAPGGQALFEITVRNNGSSDVRGLKLSDTTNANLGNPQLPQEANDGFDLPANSGRTFIVSAKVTDTTSPGDPLQNTVDLDTLDVIDGVKSDPFNIDHNGPQSASGSVGDLLPAANLSLDSWTCGPVYPGDDSNTQCVAEVTNDGPGVANSVLVSQRFISLVTQANGVGFATTEAALPFPVSRLYNCSTGGSCTRVADMPVGVTDTLTFYFHALKDSHLDDRSVNDAAAYVQVSAANPDSTVQPNRRTLRLDVEPKANLRIEKELLTPTVAPGGSALFEVTIYNDGPADVDGIRVDENILSGPGTILEITPEDAAAPGGDGVYIAAKSSLRIMVVVAIDPGALPGDVITNQATINTGQVDAGQSTLTTATGYNGNINDSLVSEEDLTISRVLPEADLRVTDLTCSEVTPGANADTTCTVTITNKGPGSAQNATLALRLRNLIPQNQTVGSSGVTTTQGGVNVGKLWNCSTGFNCTRREPMPVDTVDTITFRFRSLPDAHLNVKTNRNIRAEAWLTADSPDPKAGNNFRRQFLDVSPKATVRIEKELLTPNTAPGGTALFAVTLYNDGPADIDGIRIDDQIITGNGTIVSISPTRADANGAGGGLYIPADGSATILVAVEVDAATAPGDTLTNEVTVDVDALDAVISTLATATGYNGNLNNTIKTSASLTIGNYLPEADMKASAVVPLNDALAGGVYEFELYVRNKGDAPAEGVTVHHILGEIPGDWQVVDDPNQTTPNWRCDGQGSTCTRIGAMPVGKELVGVFRVLLPPDAVTEGFSFGEGVHQISVTADNPDPNRRNNQKTSFFDIYTESLLSIEKIALENELVAGGDSILFKINVTNDGPSDAYDVEVVDLPGDLTLVSMSSSNLPMDCLGDDCLIPVLPAGETAIIDVVIKAGPGLPPSILAGPYENQAQILDCLNTEFDACDFPPEPVGAEVDVVGWADLKLQKFVKPDGAIAAGETFIFTIFVDNLGVSSANNVVVEDTMFSNGKFRLKDVSDDRGACAVTTPQTGNKNAPVSFNCALTSLERYGRWTITAKVVANDEVDVNNEARVHADDPQDPDMSNNSDTASMSVGGSADLSVEKAAVTASVNAGETASWTITVNNVGPSLATNVVIRDILPAAIVADTVTVAPDTYACTIGTPGDPADPTICNLGNIDSGGAPIVLTISGQVAPDYRGSPEIINDVSVASDTADPDGGNNRDTANVAVSGMAGLSISKQSLPGAVNAGEIVDYSIAVSNGGPSVATNTKVTDALPVEMNYSSAEVVGGDGTECSYAPGPREVTCVLGDLAPGSSQQVLINVTVKPDTAPGDVINEAAVSSDTAPTQTDQATTTVGAVAGISATKRSSSLNPATGEVFFYMVEVTNRGPSTAKNVEIFDELTGSVQYLYSRGAMCSNSGNDVTCNLGDLAVGQTMEFDIVVQVKDWVKDGHKSDNVIEITSDTPVIGGQPVLAYSEEIVFRNTNDLMIRKFGKPDGTVDAGNKLTYTIIVDNFGPGYAYKTLVRDFLASDGAYDFEAPSFCSPSSGAATGNQQLDCDLGTVEPGDQFIFTVEVTAKEAQTINNTAEVSADGTDLDRSNNNAIVEHEIDAVADLRIIKVADANMVDAGGVVRYTITVHNDGPSTADNVTVMDTLPGGATVVSIDTSQGSCTTEPIKCALGNLGANQTAQVVLRAAINADIAPGAELINNAFVTSDAFDDDMGDNLASVGVTVKANLLLDVQKDVSTNNDVTAGNEVDFRIVVRNTGKSTVHNVVVKDDLPDDLHFVSYSIVGNAGSCVDTLFDPEVVCDVGTVAPGEERTIYVRAQVDPSAPSGNLVNIVTPDPLFDTNTSDLSATVKVVNSTHIRLETEALVTSVRPGDIFAYLVRVINDGPSAAKDVTVNVDLPSILTYVSDTIGCGEALTGCMLGDMQPNTQREFQVLVQIDEMALNATQVAVTATASTSTANATIDTSQGTSIIVVNGPAGRIYLPLVNR